MNFSLLFYFSYSRDALQVILNCLAMFRLLIGEGPAWWLLPGSLKSKLQHQVLDHHWLLRHHHLQLQSTGEGFASKGHTATYLAQLRFQLLLLVCAILSLCDVSSSWASLVRSSRCSWLALQSLSAQCPSRKRCRSNWHLRVEPALPHFPMWFFAFRACVHPYSMTCLLKRSFLLVS